MIGFHIQNSPPDWPRAVSKLPAGAPVKFCFGVERSSEALEANPDAYTWYRWLGDQHLPSSNYEAHARAWLNNFIDGSFKREAGFVDYTQEYNETLANSQSAEEKARWIALHTAMAKVWAEEYRTGGLAHIKLILCEAAIGNDIPIEIARASVQYDALLGYHPYQVCRLTGRAANFWKVGSSFDAARDVRFDGRAPVFAAPVSTK